MGIIKLSDPMHENLRIASAALSRSINAQAEHWMRIGMLAELHPELPHAQLCQMLVRAELQGGLDLAQWVAGPWVDSGAAPSSAKPPRRPT
ncbi:plasmid stability protein [Inhella inkyongensis]|uniref:Plasmid stability protein n=1 Tax=Inhella inkyongensis TaxID=392593 RepID=A0A840S0Q7_9BURK|nr:ParD-like family protein [Inhella inkyongensis]MBB5202978.1 plasmid stability protein [Inhella inkyongensis]